MVMHPHLLHCRAALWSLKRAMERLDAARAAGVDEDRGTLRAWAPSDGGGRASGVRSLADVVELDAGIEGKSFLELKSESAMSKWSWLFGLRTPDQMIEMMDRVPSSTAEKWLPWVEEVDRDVRAVLRMGDDREPMPGVDCPDCGQRRLSRRMSAPADQRVIVCECGFIQ